MQPFFAPAGRRPGERRPCAGFRAAVLLLLFAFVFPGAGHAIPTLPSMFGDHPWALGLGGGMSAELGFSDAGNFSDSLFLAARWRSLAAGLAREGDVFHWNLALGGRAKNSSLQGFFGGAALNLFSGEGYTDLTATLGMSYAFSRHLLLEYRIRDIVLSREAGGRIMPQYGMSLYIGAEEAPLTLQGFFSFPASVDNYAFGAHLFVRPLRGLELSINVRRENEEYGVGAGLGIAFGDVFLRGRIYRREGGNTILASAVYGEHGRGRIFGEEDSMLELVVSGAMSETAQAGNSLLGAQESSGFASCLLALYRAAHDTSLKLVVLRLREHSLGYARSEELMDALLRLRRAGKSVVAVLEKGGLRNLLIASAANEIHLDPNVQFEIARPAMTAVFYKSFLDKIGLEAQLFYRGAYKTAAQAATEPAMTPEHRESAGRVLENIGERALALIAANRGCTPEQAAAWCRTGLMTPEEALRAGLVTHLGSYAHVRGLVSRHDLRMRSLGHYRALSEGFRENNAIALISVEGTLVNGISSRRSLPFAGRSAGAETIIGALQQALRDHRVRGIIVRIDSGGGDILASARMREAILLAAGVKPLVLSMGDAAASGGFWIACGDDKVKLDISAGASTLTGSIGVIVGKVSTEKLRAILGIQSERLGDANARMFDDNKGFTTEQRGLVEKMLDYWYAQFVDLVAGGRRLSRESALESAAGRVWTGGDAHARGLVDRNAGFIGAYEFLVERLRGKPLDYECIELPQTQPNLTSLITQGLHAGMNAGGGQFLTEWPALAASLGDADSWPGLFISGRALALLPWSWEFE